VGNTKIIFNPINQYHNISEKIALVIKNFITDGKLKAGDRLPSERDLAPMLGVSRNSLREALKVLATSGIVEIRHGQGVFIKSHESQHLFKQYLDGFNIDKRKLHDLYCVRRVLETQAVEWACVFASTEELEKIKETLLLTKKELLTSEDPMLLLAKSDENFHNLIIKASYNSILEKMMPSLFEFLIDARLESAKKGRAFKSLEEHLEIADTLLDRDISKARLSMEKHLTAVERDLVEEKRHPLVQEAGLD